MYTPTANKMHCFWAGGNVNVMLTENSLITQCISETFTQWMWVDDFFERAVTTVTAEHPHIHSQTALKWPSAYDKVISFQRLTLLQSFLAFVVFSFRTISWEKEVISIILNMMVPEPVCSRFCCTRVYVCELWEHGQCGTHMAMTGVQPLLNHACLAFNFMATCYVAEGHDCVYIICMSSVQHLCYFLQSSITDTQYLEMIFSFRIRISTKTVQKHST